MTSKKMSKPANLVLASLGLLLSLGALAESAPTTYTYDANLDIQNVLSISSVEEGRTCKPIDYIMKYADSSGKIQTVKYKALSDACSRGH
ncbi:DUF2790 domain-containing protein [Stutzerimonas xanthomarina]|uniref:DUF2790 domain-containing protein n=2 Tax=Stutzerimonas xanthomarina TaxID=271420 RepID=A0A1M5S5L0_9GAMM|nr:DUF2790 domain-containing protein [Stutzerimonas xanthomarina]MCP9340692.1 DUF2790 domain-containing protein [Stutzerimonas xanthomarina]SEH98433.1 Protein of unknown function [Stutzerimonas xanthomarina]SHH33887.1 Protein of unknown function [Stutzerimonas xanthomarina DSM 18231]